MDWLNQFKVFLIKKMIEDLKNTIDNIEVTLSIVDESGITSPPSL